MAHHACACGDHAFLPIGKWGVTLVSPEDGHLLVDRTWWLVVVASAGLAYAGAGPSSLHQAVAGPADIIDHANGNGLDNRRSNLRPCTHAQNMMNRRAQKNGTSRFKGVWISRYGKWKACIQHEGSTIHLGTFPTEEDAARAYDKAAIKLFGEFARTNEMLDLYRLAA